MSFWKILRVLVADHCNYQCVFCHNEGQVSSGDQNGKMPLQQFKKIISALADTEIKEIQFSGGEPFTNSETIEMIEYVHAHTQWEIGCASNGQLITESTARRLSNTRVKVNINLPDLNPDRFREITQWGSLARLLGKLDLFDLLHLDYAFNTVTQAGGIPSTLSVIDFAWQKGKRLKILPYVDRTHPARPTDEAELFHYLDRISKSAIIEPTSRKWVLADRGSGNTTIKYVNFPCYNQDINACREYAEVRLLPDFRIQPCLIRPDLIYRLDGKSNEAFKTRNIIPTFEMAWKNFISC